MVSLLTRTSKQQLYSDRHHVLLRADYELERRSKGKGRDADAVLAEENDFALDVAARVDGQILRAEELLQSGLLVDIVDYLRRIKADLAIEQVLEPTVAADKDDDDVSVLGLSF
jgi:hypothetical protein